MKKLLIAALGLATIATTTAFAETSNSRVRAQVQRPTVVSSGQYLNYDPYTVIEHDRVVGRDPDANVREQMRRDPVQNEY
jgi:hypothetical protein